MYLDLLLFSSDPSFNAIMLAAIHNYITIKNVNNFALRDDVVSSTALESKKRKFTIFAKNNSNLKRSLDKSA
jgi:hypothetical protein